MVTQFEIGRQVIEGNRLVFIDIETAYDSVIKSVCRDTVERKLNRLE